MAAFAAFGDHDFFAGPQKLVQHFTRLRVADEGADGHFQRHVFACRAKAVRPHAVLAAFGFVAAGIAVVHQRVQVGIGYGVNVAAAPAVAAIGAAEFLVFLVAE